VTTAYLLIEDINPTPWMSPDLSVGRSKGGKPYPIAYSPAAMRAYEDAIKESFDQAYPGTAPFKEGTQLSAIFFVWRKLDQYKTPTGRNQTAKRADATNMQKATEDALQKRLYVNDVDNFIVATRIVEQSTETEPKILVVVSDSHVASELLFGDAEGPEELARELKQQTTPPNPPGNVYLKVIQ